MKQLLPAPQLLYSRITGISIDVCPRNVSLQDRCGICGGILFQASLKNHLLNSTFTDHDVLSCSKYVCGACVFLLSEKEHGRWLMDRLGRDKPQRLRNYSVIIDAGGVWFLSKGQKAEIAQSLRDVRGFPELAVIAVSGQKHLVFKTSVNQPAQTGGYVKFEERGERIDQQEFIETLEWVEALYRAGFAKGRILSGDYIFYDGKGTALDIGLWREIEPRLRKLRGGLLLEICCYLAVLSEDKNEQEKEQIDD